MTARILPWLAIGLILAAPAYAQLGGGVGGGQSAGQGGGVTDGVSGRRGGRQDGSDDSRRAPLIGPTAAKPTTGIEIFGVITAMDPAAQRMTIAYEPVEELNWSKGQMPFPVAKAELMRTVKVGDKIAFRLEDHEIYAIRPLDPPKQPGS